MKANTKKKGNPAKKLIPAAGSLMVSAVMLATSTYAWFTMNKTVQVNGMSLQTKVSGNLLICTDNLEANYKPDTITQTRQALLEPVSTINGSDTSFWYTTDATADGKMAHNDFTGTHIYTNYNEGTNVSGETYAVKAKYDPAFNGANAYNISTTTNNVTAAYQNAYGYVDYTFFLKATSDDNNQLINMTRCNLVYNENGSGSDAVLGENNDAWRVAVFATDITDSHAGDGDTSTAVTASGTSPKTILAPNGAAYFSSSTSGEPAVTTYKAVTENAAPSASVVNFSNAAVIDTIATAGTTKYYKVDVRVWLEGEDTKCFSANYSTVESLYKLDLAFELGKGSAVTEIGSSTEAWTPTANPTV